MKMKNLKLFGLTLAGVLSMASLTGCESEEEYHEEKGCEFIRQFDIGEHIISVPLEELEDDIRDNPTQIEFHPGYEVVGISVASYGSSSYYGGGVIVYTNAEVVECSTRTYDKEGNYVYLDFGVPLDYEEENTASNDEPRVFDVGEHIISIPITDDVREDNRQYDYHEGYEVVGISVAAYGSSSYYGGGVILYKNSVPVKAYNNGNGYTTFGEVITKEHGRGLN